MPLQYDIPIILLLILANGIFAMSEFAIISARRARLQQRAEEGDRGARAALDLANEPNRFLSTIQIGITLIGILAGAFGGATVAQEIAPTLATIPAVAGYADALAIAVVVVTISYLSLVFGELVPKRLALIRAERIASAVAGPMRVLSILASPIVRLLSVSTDLVLWVFGGRGIPEPPVTEEEIRYMIQQGTEAGVFEEVEEDMVKSVFRLGDRRVSALMTPRPDIVGVDVNDPAEENWRRMRESGHKNFPVYREHLDNILGTVSVRDLWQKMVAGRTVDLNTSLAQPLFVPEGLPALKVLEQFKQSGTEVALVVDEYSSIVGLVTPHDILEAIVGDIPSVDQPVEAQAVQRPDGSWLIDGMMLLDDFRDLFKVGRLPDEDKGFYQTLGGFIMTYLGRIPKTGSTFEWGGFRFEVVDMDRNRVDKVLVTPQTTAGSEASPEDRGAL